MRNHIFALFFFILCVSSPSFATPAKAFDNLDSATEMVGSAWLFLAHGPFDYKAADNNIRKAVLKVQAAKSQGAKGKGKFTGAKLRTFNQLCDKLLQKLAAARTAAQGKKPGSGIKALNSSYTYLEKAMKIANFVVITKCEGIFQTEFAGVTDIYISHAALQCPFIYDEVDASFITGEIGSLSYGYSNDGHTSENDAACSQNNLTNSVCSGIPGRPGGYYRTRHNFYAPGGPPTTIYLSFKRHGTVVGSAAIP